MIYLILAQTDFTARTLIPWRDELSKKYIKLKMPKPLIMSEDHVQRDAGVYAYNYASRYIESFMRNQCRGTGCEVAILVDYVRPLYLSAISRPCWDSLIAMLVLSYPEVRWHFGYACFEEKQKEKAKAKGDADPEEQNVSKQTRDSNKQSEYLCEKWYDINYKHSLPALFHNIASDPLMDPSGLREWVRSRTNKSLEDSKEGWELPTRDKLAAAIDEEPSYAYFYGYTAYRFGCRADIITTWELMRHRFGEEQGYNYVPDNPKSHGYWLLLEDMSLCFPDREAQVKLLTLTNRAVWCKKLCNQPDVEDSEYRFLITTGQSSSGTELIENEKYLTEYKGEKSKAILKPLGGIFGLWKDSGILELCINEHPGNCPGFVWPPTQNRNDHEAGPSRNDNKKNLRHGAPGKLNLIAESMVRRAEHLLGHIESVNDAVRGAVIACDALQCTGCKAPATAFEALALRHKFEVMAECRFSGIEHHLNVKDRIREIEKDAEAISAVSAPNRQIEARLNGEMEILLGIARIFHQNSQFDEENTCMNKTRNLHNKLWLRQHTEYLRPGLLLFQHNTVDWLRLFLQYCFWALRRYIPTLLCNFFILSRDVLSLLRYVFLRYVESLLSSGLKLALWTTLWIFLLSCCFVYVNDYGYSNLIAGLADAISTFFSGGAPVTHALSPTNGPDVTYQHFAAADGKKISWWHIGVACFSMMAGVLHLGVLIAHLYAIVSRK